MHIKYWPSPDTAHIICCLGPSSAYPLTSIYRGMKKHQHVDHYFAELCEQLWETFKEAQVQSTSEAERQKWHYDRKANAISLEQGDLVLAKTSPYRGRRNVKDQWEEELFELEHQVAEGIPSYLMRNQWKGCSGVLDLNQLFLITPTKGTPLSMVVQAKWTKCTTTTLEEQTPKERLEKHHKVQIVHCRPNIRQVRFL